MLEITQEILERVDPLLDDRETDTAAMLLAPLDRTSLRALLFHVLQERGAAVADAVARAYLRANSGTTRQLEVA